MSSPTKPHVLFLGCACFLRDEPRCASMLSTIEGVYTESSGERPIFHGGNTHTLIMAHGTWGSLIH